MTTIAPIAGSHAIKTVSFGLEWRAPLSEDVLLLLKTLHVKVRDRLPRLTQQEAIELQILVSPDPPPQPAPANPRLAGLKFEALQPNGEPHWSLVIQGNFLAVTCHVYSRWQEIWPQARGLLAPFVPVLARECGIAVIGLQYSDQFRAIGPAGTFLAADLWRAGSPLLPAQVFTLQDLWHAHHGFFEQLDEPRSHRRLNNIDVDVIAVNQQHLIQLTTAHRAFLDQQTRDSAQLLGGSEDGLLDHFMGELHQVNKRILRQILNDAVCHHINLRVAS